MRVKYRKALSRRKRRHVRVRAKVSGTALRPRLNVFRSSAHIYAQVIDDIAGHTLVAASDLESEIQERAGGEATKTAKAKAVGQIVAERIHGVLRTVAGRTAPILKIVEGEDGKILVAIERAL